MVVSMIWLCVTVQYLIGRHLFNWILFGQEMVMDMTIGQWPINFSKLIVDIQSCVYYIASTLASLLNTCVSSHMEYVKSHINMESILHNMKSIMM